MSTEVDVFLAHYGVKGMHWGKHKAKSSSSTAVAKTGGSSKAVAKRAPIDKAKLKAARASVYGDVKKMYTGNNHKQVKVAVGLSLAGAMLGGTVGSSVVGTQMMQGAGFSKGKSFAVGVLGGAPGAMLAIELKSRKMARGG